MKRTVILIIGTISIRCNVESQSDKGIYDLTCDLETVNNERVPHSYRL